MGGLGGKGGGGCGVFAGGGGVEVGVHKLNWCWGRRGCCGWEKESWLWVLMVCFRQKMRNMAGWG